ncbi:MAG: serine/threonine-protein kinase [Thermoanaerobaculia bacterium]
MARAGARRTLYRRPPQGGARRPGRSTVGALIGRTLSHYRITAAIGVGGMGELYRATDTKLGRDVALKVLPAEMAADPERLGRFQREARALAPLDHPGIVGVFSVEESDGVHFLTMQLVEGESLDHLIPEGGFPLDQFLEIAVPLSDALAAAHEKGIVRRDLKPANVMVGERGRVKVLDFGLARLAAPKTEELLGSQLPTEMRTREGVVMGTVPYMSPEQVSGRAVDHRTDIFSLGIILYEMASGSRPFQGNSSAELISSILRDIPSAVTELRSELPRDLARVIRRCLEKDTRDRLQSARDLHNELKGLRAEIASAAASGVAPSQSGRERSADRRSDRCREPRCVAPSPPAERGATAAASSPCGSPIGPARTGGRPPGRARSDCVLRRARPRPPP